VGVLGHPSGLHLQILEEEELSDENFADKIVHVKHTKERWETPFYTKREGKPNIKSKLLIR